MLFSHKKRSREVKELVKAEWLSYFSASMIKKINLTKEITERAIHLAPISRYTPSQWRNRGSKADVVVSADRKKKKQMFHSVHFLFII